MDQRFIFAAFAGIFAVAFIFATIMTVRHIGKQPEPAGTSTQKLPTIKKQGRPNTIAVRLALKASY